LYANLLPLGKIAFVPKVLNFHRRHAATVTSSIERDERAIIEQLRVKAWIFEHMPPSINTMNLAIAQTAAEYYRLGEMDNLDRGAFVDNPALQPLLRRLRQGCASSSHDTRSGSALLIVIGDTEMGGGQVSAIRLANAFAKRRRVFLCNARPEAFDPSVAGLVSSNVQILEGTLGPTPWAKQSRPVEHQRNRLSEGSRRIMVVRDLIRFHDVGLIMSHIWWADRFTLAVNRTLRLPWFIRMHGCYEALVQHSDWDPEFGELTREAMHLVSAVCYSSSRNLSVFEVDSIPRPARARLFYNGLDPTAIPQPAAYAGVQGSPDDFVFCLCSRAIAEKGWEEAIAATLQINCLDLHLRAHKRARLLLIGDSQYARDLKIRYAQYAAIEFLGQLQNPLPHIQACCVGVLPSRFISESAPSSIVEYLACGKPVIATMLGSIPDMIVHQGRQAGLLLPSQLSHLDLTSALRDAMLRYMTVPGLLQEHASIARRLFDSRFNLDHLAEQYLEFFDEQDIPVAVERR
jgi:glycosyltransferase involved in cell wall biosynthesis